MAMIDCEPGELLLFSVCAKHTKLYANRDGLNFWTVAMGEARDLAFIAWRVPGRLIASGDERGTAHCAEVRSVRVRNL
jgi:hypothetical protein